MCYNAMKSILKEMSSMKWNKEAVAIVGAIFLLSYFYSSKVEYDLNSKIKAQSLKNCLEQKYDYCDMIDTFHDICFPGSYRSRYKAMHFFSDEYDACIKEQVAKYTGKL